MTNEEKKAKDESSSDDMMIVHTKRQSHLTSMVSILIQFHLFKCVWRCLTYLMNQCRILKSRWMILLQPLLLYV